MLKAIAFVKGHFEFDFGFSQLNSNGEVEQTVVCARTKLMNTSVLK